MIETKFDIIFDSQKIFRTVLDAYAYPGKVVKIPNIETSLPPDSSKAALAILLTLLDHEVGFAVAANDKKQREEMSKCVYDTTSLH